MYKKDIQVTILSYNNAYPTNTVFLRMPVSEQTTVEEVEDFFVKFAETFKVQQPIIEQKRKDDEILRK